MYTDTRGMNPELVSFLEQWEQDHDVPIRVLGGGWQGTHSAQTNNWTDRQVRGSAYTRQQASAQGVTIYHAAAVCPEARIGYGGTMPIPPARLDVSLADRFECQPDADFGNFSPILWSHNGHEQVYGEYGERVLVFYFALNRTTAHPDYVDYALLFANLEDTIDSEAAERRRQQLLAASFEHFMEFMNEGRINRQIQALREQIAAHERNMTSWQNSLAEAYALANGMNAQIESMMRQAGQSREEWQRQYEMIANNPAVESLLFRHNSLEITTHDIHLRGQREYEGQTRWLGRFKITVGLSNHQTRIVNLDNRQSGRDHPHVLDGSPCFGGNASEFYTLLGSGQFGIYIELILQWLENYNPRDDWGQYAANWFEIEDQYAQFHPETTLTEDASADTNTENEGVATTATMATTAA